MAHSVTEPGPQDLFGQAAYVFNGTSTVGSAPNSSAYNMPAFTIEAYVSRAGYDPHTGGGYQLVRRENANTTGNQFMLGFSNDRMQVEAYCFGIESSHGYSRTDPLWHHVALTFDGSAVRIYIDGVLDHEVSYPHPSCISTNSGAGPIRFGNNRSSSDFFQGSVQYIRVSNTARSSFPYASYLNIRNLPSVAAGTVTDPPVIGTPDLVVLELTIQPYAQGGSLVTAVIQNQGEQNTQNGFYTDLYLDHVPTGVGDYTGSLRAWVNDPIGAGETVTLTTVISDLAQLGGLSLQSVGTMGQTSGTLYAQVDSTGAVAEPDEGNNITGAGTPICLAAPDAFEVDDSSASARLVNFGESYGYNFDHPGDTDWIRFDAQEGDTYELLTADLGVASDTICTCTTPTVSPCWGSMMTTTIRSPRASNGLRLRAARITQKLLTGIPMQEDAILTTR